MTYHLTCKVCNQAFTRLTKPRRERSKFGPICSRKECRKQLAQKALHNPEAVAQRAVEKARREGPVMSIGCEWGAHQACDPARSGCQCPHHNRTKPRLGTAPLPSGFAVKRYPEPPADPLEAILRRLEAQG